MSKLQKQFLIDQFGMQRGHQLYVSLTHLMNHNMENHINVDKKRQFEGFYFLHSSMSLVRHLLFLSLSGTLPYFLPQ